MAESASKAGDDSTCSAKHTMGEEAEAGTWRLETLNGTPRTWHCWLHLFPRDTV